MKEKKKKIKDNKRGTLLVRHIPTTIKDFYKAYCAKRGKTMSQDIISHIRDCAKQSETSVSEITQHKPIFEDND